MGAALSLPLGRPPVKPDTAAERRVLGRQLAVAPRRADRRRRRAVDDAVLHAPVRVDRAGVVDLDPVAAEVLAPLAAEASLLLVDDEIDPLGRAQVALPALLAGLLSEADLHLALHAPARADLHAKPRLIDQHDLRLRRRIGQLAVCANERAG